MFFQFQDSLFPIQFEMLGQFVYVIAHLDQQFFLGNTADGCIWLIHTYIPDIIQLAEDAELGELGNAGEEDKAQQRLTVLQRRIEIAHSVAKNI